MNRHSNMCAFTMTEIQFHIEISRQHPQKKISPHRPSISSTLVMNYGFNKSFGMYIVLPQH